MRFWCCCFGNMGVMLLSKSARLTLRVRVIDPGTATTVLFSAPPVEPLRPKNPARAAVRCVRESCATALCLVVRSRTGSGSCRLTATTAGAARASTRAREILRKRMNTCGMGGERGRVLDVDTAGNFPGPFIPSLGNAPNFDPRTASNLLDSQGIPSDSSSPGMGGR